MNEQVQTVPLSDLGRAQHCLMQGDLHGAIDIYKTLLEARPEDMRMQERFASLLHEDGQIDAARILYRIIARHWEDAGFYLRALESYRVLSELAPGDLNAQRHLAELYAALHLNAPATVLYRRLADIFAAQHNVRRRLVMLERIATLNPMDVEAHLLYASELDEQGERQASNAQLLEALAACLHADDLSRYARVANRYLDRVPDDDNVRAELARIEAQLSGRTVDVPPSVHTIGGTAPYRPPSNRQHARPERTAPVAGGIFADLEPPQNPEEKSEVSMLVALASMDARQAEPSCIDIPRAGELGAFATRPFGPSSEILLQNSGHVVAAAIRARKRGDDLLALALLEDEAASQYPLAAEFEGAVAHIAQEQWGTALSKLSNLMDAALADADRALVAYHLGVVTEVTHDTMLARVSFERVQSLCPQEARDVPARLARLDDAGE